MRPGLRGSLAAAVHARDGACLERPPLEAWMHAPEHLVEVTAVEGIDDPAH